MADATGATLMAKKSRASLVQAQRSDGFANSLLGVGELGMDKRLGGTGANRNRFIVPTVGRTQFVDLWRANDMAARIVEDLPNEMYREGFDVLVSDDAKLSEEMGALFDELGVAETLRFAECRARAEGGALIVLGANDGLDTSLPLNMDGIRSFEWLNVCGCDDVGVFKRYDDPTAPNFGKPELYQVKAVPRADGRMTPGVYIHESRVIRFDGVVVGGAKYQSGQLSDGWGDSVLLRVWQVLQDFEMSWSNAAVIMAEFAIGVFKFKNLAELMAGDQDGAVVARMRMANLSKSLINALMMDSEETFERVTTPLAGVPEVLQQFAIRLAAAADMPVTRLMGQSPAGLNATGASDIRFYYDRIKSTQNRSARPKINRICQCVFRSKTGPSRGKEPENWTIRFRPLWQMTEAEQAAVRFTMAQADEKYIQNNVTTAEEIAASRFGGDDFSTDTRLDLETRNKLRAALEAGSEKDQETALNGAQVASMLEIVTKVATGVIPRDAGVAILAAAFPIDETEAEAVLGNAGAGFVPTVAPPPGTVQTSAMPNRQTLNAAE